VDYNYLLFWASARTSGSWGSFRSATEEFSTLDGETDGAASRGRTYQTTRLNFQQLGHIEYGSPSDSDWQVSPPVIAVHEETEGKIAAIACGARLPGLLNRLNGVPGISFESIQVEGQPDVVRVSAETLDALETNAFKAGFLVQKNASMSLLSCLPKITDLASWRAHQRELPFGKQTSVSRLEINRAVCRWTESSVEEAGASAHGLFRFTRYQQRTHYLRACGQTFQVPSQLGNYLLAAGHRCLLLRFNRTTHELTVPAVCRPPLLIDRALVLCSGKLPTLDRERWILTYGNIPEVVAGKCAEVLCQEEL
jgi:hypothetical protein